MKKKPDFYFYLYRIDRNEYWKKLTECSFHSRLKLFMDIWDKMVSISFKHDDNSVYLTDREKAKSYQELFRTFSVNPIDDKIYAEKCQALSFDKTGKKITMYRTICCQSLDWVEKHPDPQVNYSLSRS